MTSIETTKIDLADLDFVFRQRPITQSKRLADRLFGGPLTLKALLCSFC